LYQIQELRQVINAGHASFLNQVRIYPFQELAHTLFGPGNLLLAGAVAASVVTFFTSCLRSSSSAIAAMPGCGVLGMAWTLARPLLG